MTGGGLGPGASVVVVVVVEETGVVLPNGVVGIREGVEGNGGR